MIQRSIAVLALCIGVAGVAIAEEPLRIAVVAVGGDHAAVGALQATIEMRLREERGIALVSSTEIANILKVPDAPDTEDHEALTAQRTKQIDAAESLYYEDRHNEALTLLNRTEQAQATHLEVPGGERVRLYLWRAAANLALDQRPNAEIDARHALTLAPALKVDLEVFRPSLARLIDAVRTKGLPTATIEVQAQPGNAIVRIDGRPIAGSKVTLPIGTHYVSASAAGFHPIARKFEVRAAGSRLSFSLPLLLPREAEREFQSMIGRGRANANDEAGLEQFAGRLDVDGLIIAASRSNPTPQLRAAMWWWEDRGVGVSKVFTPRDGGPLAVAGWVVPRVREKSGGGRPNGNGGNGPPRPPVEIDISVEAGVAVVGRRYRLESIAGGGTDVTFPGMGGKIRADTAISGWFADASLQFLTYSVLTPTVTFPGNITKQIPGGTSLNTGLIGGFRAPVARNLSLEGWVGGSYELHTAEAERQRFPSYTRISVDLGTGANIELGQLAATARFGLSPFSVWSETPNGATGSGPKPGVAFLWNARASWAPLDRWIISAEYDGWTRSIQFAGDSGTVFDPPLRDAKLQETIHGGIVSVRLAF